MENVDSVGREDGEDGERLQWQKTLARIALKMKMKMKMKMKN